MTLNKRTPNQAQWVCDPINIPQESPTNFNTSSVQWFDETEYMPDGTGQNGSTKVTSGELCTLNTGTYRTQSIYGYFYMFQFPSKGSDHTALGVFFAAAPGYTQVWKSTDNGNTWSSVGGTEFLDTVDTTAWYGMYISTSSGWTSTYNCAITIPGCSGTVNIV